MIDRFARMLGRTRRGAAAVLVAFFCLLACAHAVAGTRAPLRVLFIGNSLTNRNDLPAAFKRYVETTHPGTRIETRMIAPDGETLAGHRSRGDAEQAISREKWDFVVFQEGYDLVPSYSLNGAERYTRPTQFYEQQAFFSALARQHGARPVILEVWSGDKFAYVDYASVRAAHDTHSDIAPVGRVWSALTADGKLVLEGPDKIHPNETGTYLIAATLAETLFGPARASANSDTVGVDVARAISRTIGEQVRKIHARRALEHLVAPEYADDEPTLVSDQPLDSRLAGTWRAIDGGFRLSFGTEIRVDAQTQRLSVAVKDFFTSAPLEPEVRELQTGTALAFKIDTGSVHYTVKAVPVQGDLKVLTAYNPNKTHRVYRLVTYRRDGDAAYFDRLHALYEQLAENARRSGLAAALKSHYEALPTLVDAETFRAFRQGFPISEWDPIMAGMYYEDHGNAARALPYYEAAAQLYPRSIDALAYYGRALASAGQAPKARELLVQALTLAGGKDTREGAAIASDLEKLGTN